LLACEIKRTEMTIATLAPQTDEFQRNGWLFQSTHGPISSSRELDIIQRELGAPQLPTMVFGGNAVRLQHVSTGWSLEFNCRDALNAVDFTAAATAATGTNSLQVAMAQHWQQSRPPLQLTSNYRPFDWTFTPRGYAGSTFNGGNCEHSKASSSPSSSSIAKASHQIDYERLRDRTKPILWFAENILYEDELADNGLAQLCVRVRVMPDCWLVLMRFYLRVEGVLCRSLETRVYHTFGADWVAVESSHRECADWQQLITSTIGQDIQQFPVSEPSAIQRISSSLPLVTTPQCSVIQL
jgi:type 2A phosphatase activator TIP41